MVDKQQTANLIEIKGLSKRYSGTKEFSLHNLSLSVASGEVYGFLGSNGAGKSTTIRTLLNFIQPTNGQAKIAGFDIVKQSVSVKKQIGYLSGDVVLYNKLTGQQFLDYMQELQPAKDATYLKKLVKDFKADLKRPIGDLSKGNRQKIGIIQAFMHQPNILILDEPTSGLDPLMQEVFFEAVRETKQRGGCVFFSSHNLSEIQRICDRVGFIRAGKLIKEQKISDLLAKAAHTFDVIFDGAAEIAKFKQIKSAETTLSKDKTHLSVSLPTESLPQLFSILSGCKIQQFHQREANLEAEFLDFYKQDNQKDEATI